MKTKTPSFETLSNPQHEAFAQEVASGRNATEAYLKVYGTENRRTAASGGHRLLRRKSIVGRIQALQQAGADGVSLNLRQIHDFLTRAVRTPAGQVTPSSDLCTRVKHTRHGATDVWMPDKLACLRLSAKLQGFLDPGRLARPDAKSAESTESEEFLPDGTRILTEERRAVIMKAKHDDMVARIQRQEEEDRLAREQQLAQEKCLAAERPILDEKKRPENPPAQPAPGVPPPQPPGPKLPPWIGPAMLPGPHQWTGVTGTPSWGGYPTPPPKPAPASRVTPEDSPKSVTNSHHPSEPDSKSAGTRQPEPKPAPILNAWDSQNPTPEQRARLSREAAIRLRLTGDGCTSDALVVL